MILSLLTTIQFNTNGKTTMKKSIRNLRNSDTSVGPTELSIIISAISPLFNLMTLVPTSDILNRPGELPSVKFAEYTL
jgi:hypothetical protein